MTDRQRIAQEADAMLAHLDDSQDDRIKAKARADLTRRLALLMAGVALVLAAVMGGWALVTVIDGTNAIKSCTTPGGACYQDGQRRTAQAIAQINQAQAEVAREGSKPAQDSLVQSKANAQTLQRVLGILERQYPDAADAVRNELEKEATTP